MGYQNGSRWITSLWVKRFFTFLTEEEMLAFEKDSPNKRKTKPVKVVFPMYEPPTAQVEIGPLSVAMDRVLAAILSKNPAVIRKTAGAAVNLALERKGNKPLSDDTVETISVLVSQIFERLHPPQHGLSKKALQKKRKRRIASLSASRASNSTAFSEPRQPVAAPIRDGEANPLADPLPAPYKAPPLQAKHVAVKRPLWSKTNCG